MRKDSLDNDAFHPLGEGGFPAALMQRSTHPDAFEAETFQLQKHPIEHKRYTPGATLPLRRGQSFVIRLCGLSAFPLWSLRTTQPTTGRKGVTDTRHVESFEAWLVTELGDCVS